jgi:predicted XRE-type DNA-binding protein
MSKNESVFHDLGFSEAESLALTVKADLHTKLLAVIEARHLTSRELEKIFDVPQPRVSELLNGKISTMSIEKLLTYLQKLDMFPLKLKERVSHLIENTHNLPPSLRLNGYA